MEDHLFGGVFRQLFDDGAFRVSRVAAGGADDAECGAAIPFDFNAVELAVMPASMISEKSLLTRIMIGCVSGRRSGS